MSLLIVTIFSLSIDVCIGIFPVNCDIKSLALPNTPTEVPDPPGSPLLSRIVNTYQACSSLCRFYKDCTHYNWQQSSGFCHLTAHSGVIPLTTCKSKARPCGDRPCKSGEMCIHVKRATSYICLQGTLSSAITKSVKTSTTSAVTTAAAETTTTLTTQTNPTKTSTATPPESTTTSTPDTTSISTTTSTTTTTTATTTTTTATTTATTTTTTTTTTSPSTTQTTTPTSTSTTTTTPTTTIATTTSALMRLGMACSTNADCIVSNAECNGGGCRCILGYQFSFTKQECSQSCDQLGTDFVLYPNTGIYEHNEENYNVNNVDECKQLCLNPAAITCRIFEIHDPLICRLTSYFWFDVSVFDRLTSLSFIDLHVRQCL